jgi:uncharacterized protein GlcG (DUF336 family)
MNLPESYDTAASADLSRVTPDLSDEAIRAAFAHRSLGHDEVVAVRALLLTAHAAARAVVRVPDVSPAAAPIAKAWGVVVLSSGHLGLSLGSRRWIP